MLINAILYDTFFMEGKLLSIISKWKYKYSMTFN